jgi:anti-sigma factor RsiW
MDCDEIRRLLDASVDGELDLLRQVDIDRHLATCARCAGRATAIRERNTALRTALPRYEAPPRLVAAVRNRLRAAQPAATATTPDAAIASGRAAPTPARAGAMLAWPGLPWQLGGIAAALILAFGGGLIWGTARARRNLLLDTAIADHIRSLQPNHLLDVVSTDRHTVKPWFAGKVEFSPPVLDLAAQGFPLAGGRLDHLDAHTAAALVYHRRQHAINLFIWPNDHAAVSIHPAARDGYNVLAWTDHDLNFLAVSEIPASELQEFATAFRAAGR